MKWFKHFSDAYINLKHQSLRAKHGLEGYGFYWMILELVAQQGENFKINAKKDWIGALMTVSGLPVEKVKTLLNYFSDNDLIDEKAYKKGDLFVPKLQEYSDEYTAKLRSKSRQSRDNVGLEEEGDGEEEQKKKIPFENFWKLYPKKVAKKKAEQKWERLTKETQEIILADLPKRVKCDQWLKGFILDPTTYLNGERWLDEIVKGPEPKFGSPQVALPPDPEEVAYQARKTAAIKACGKCDKGYVKVPGTNTMAVCECVRKLK